MAVGIGTSIGFWIMLYCVIVGMASFLGVVCVGLGGSEVREWRPIMGELGDAYTVRGFWGFVFFFLIPFAPSLSLRLFKSNSTPPQKN